MLKQKLKFKVEVARLLVENGADVFLRGDDGCLPIHLAVKYRPDVFAETQGQKESISDDDLENLQEDIIFFNCIEQNEFIFRFS